MPQWKHFTLLMMPQWKHFTLLMMSQWKHITLLMMPQWKHITLSMTPQWKCLIQHMRLPHLNVAPFITATWRHHTRFLTQHWGRFAIVAMLNGKHFTLFMRNTKKKTFHTLQEVTPKTCHPCHETSQRRHTLFMTSHWIQEPLRPARVPAPEGWRLRLRSRPGRRDKQETVEKNMGCTWSADPPTQLVWRLTFQSTSSHTVVWDSMTWAQHDQESSRVNHESEQLASWLSFFKRSACFVLYSYMFLEIQIRVWICDHCKIKLKSAVCSLLLLLL